jgi:hypothetical protein
MLERYLPTPLILTYPFSTSLFFQLFMSNFLNSVFSSPSTQTPILSNNNYGDPAYSLIQSLFAKLSDLLTQIEEKNAIISNKDAIINEKNAIISNMEATINQNNEIINQKNGIISSKEIVMDEYVKKNRYQTTQLQRKLIDEYKKSHPGIRFVLYGGNICSTRSDGSKPTIFNPRLTYCCCSSQHIPPPKVSTSTTSTSTSPLKTSVVSKYSQTILPLLDYQNVDYDSSSSWRASESPEMSPPFSAASAHNTGCCCSRCCYSRRSINQSSNQSIKMVKK